MKYSIEVDGLCKSFGEKEVLKGITLNVKEGEIFGLLDPSGAGKTTFLNVLTDQIKADAGKSFIFVDDTTKYNSEMYSKIGILMDNCGLYSRLSGYQNLKIMAMIYGVSDPAIMEVLDKVDLLKDKDTAVSKMSKGMQQRLAFAKAILNKPKILFLDEPTTGLDPVMTGYIHNMIEELASDGTTILLTTHNMDEAARLCDNVGLLCDGDIVEYGNPQQLCYKYREADLLIKNKVKSIHTLETTLQTIFVKLTGKELENE